MSHINTSEAIDLSQNILLEMPVTQPDKIGFEAICMSLFGTPVGERIEENTVKPLINFELNSVPFLELDDRVNRNFFSLGSFNEDKKALESTPMTTVSACDLQFPKPIESQTCNCKKSKCLRLHCVCFKDGGYCGPLCGCLECVNLPQFDNARGFVIKKTLEINPRAFSTKIKQLGSRDKIVNTHGCNCSRNNCKKNYCDCFKSGVGCSSLCRCESCLNGKQELNEDEKAQVIKKISRKKHKIVIGSKVELEDEPEFCARAITYVTHRKKPKSGSKINPGEIPSQ